MRPIVISLMLSLGVGVSGAEVVTVVSSKSAVTTLSKDEVTNIFLGRSMRYPDGSQAIPIDQPEVSSIREAFYQRYADKSPVEVKAYWSKIIFTGRGQPPKVVANSNELKKLLSLNLFAIGYIDDSQVDTTVRVVRAQ